MPPTTATRTLPEGRGGSRSREPRPSIYLADTDELFRRRLAESLRLCGVQVEAFSSGSELARRAHERPPDLILFTGDAVLEGGNVFARVRDARTTGRCALVLVADRNRPLPQLVGCVLEFLADWTRLYVRNLAGVLTWLQARDRSGRLELKAFGDRGTILLRRGEVVEARWKELRGRQVVEFLLEALPGVGFRFVEQGDGAEAPASAARLGAGSAALAPAAVPVPALTPVAAGLQRPVPAARGSAPRPAFDRRPPTDLHLDLARALLRRGLVGEALLHLRVAQSTPGPPGEVDYLLGLAHLRSGDLDAAREELAAADRALPGEARVRTALREAVEQAASRKSLPPSRPRAPTLPARLAVLSLGPPARLASLSVLQPESSALPPAPPAPSSAPPARSPSSTDLLPVPAAACAIETAGSVTLPPPARREAPPAPEPEPEALEAPRSARRGVEIPGGVDTRAPAEAPTAVQATPVGVPAVIEAAAVEPPLVRAALPPEVMTLDAPHGTRAGGRRAFASHRVAAAAGVALGLVAATTTLLLQRPTAAGTGLLERQDGRPAAARASDRSPSSTPTSGPAAARGDVPVDDAVPTRTADAEDPAGAGTAAVERPGPAERARRLAAGSALDLETLRSGPRSVALDARPRPSRLRHARSLRSLIEPGSGRIEVIQAWGDTMSVEREADLWVLVDASGAVRDVRTMRSSGLAMLDARGFEAIRNVVYSPGRRDGVAVPAWVRQRVVFKLD